MPPPGKDRFGPEFYRRHYLDPRRRVVTRSEMARRADLVAAFLRHGGLTVRSILDIGCGLGLMRRQLMRQFPRARYVGLEASEYLCRRYGWEHGSAATFDPGRTFDLVVCYDVLQYLDSRPAAAAIRNITRLCSGVLHFGVLTQEDWDLYCDQRDTDRNVHLRSGRWYRDRLGVAFINAGSGMFVRRDAPLHLWELDQMDSLRARAD